MRTRRILIIALVLILLGMAAWLCGRLLITAIYQGNAGSYLNGLINPQSGHPLAEYLADFDQRFLHLAMPALALLCVVTLLALLPAQRRRALWTWPAALPRLALAHLPTLTTFGGIVFLCLTGGAWFAWSGMPLYRNTLESTFNAAHAIYIDVVKQRPLLGETDTWVYDEKRPLQGLGVYRPELARDGITLVYGMQQAWLVDMDGKVLHTWQVDYDSLQADSLIPRSYPSTYIYWHQARLLPNGDLLVLVDQFDKSPSGLAMMKIDRDSHVLWVFPHHVHHDFNFGPQGTIYAVDQQVRSDPIAGLNLEAPYLDDGVLVLSPDGKYIDRFSLLEAFADTRHAAFFNGNGSYRTGDYLHTNNLDILPAGSLGNAGASMLLSFNGLSAIATLDLDSHKISRVWAGYWHHQHDPDLLDNGDIILFDNQGAWTPGQNARVIEFNPDNYAITWEYPGNSGQPLFSTYRGREQVLDNNNVLISEFENGRLLEVTRDGQLAWEYSCPFRSTINPRFVCNFVAGRRYGRDELHFPFNGGVVQPATQAAVTAHQQAD